MPSANSVMRAWSLLLLLVTATAQAGNHLLYLGGGGEASDKRDTIFDASFEAYMKNARAANWSVDARFNGGHEKSEALLAQVTGARSTGPLTAATYAEAVRATIAEYEAKFQQGKLGPNDQLMVVIDSHGSSATEKEKTHSVGVGHSKSTQKLDSMVSLDTLAPLIAIAQKSGLKLAIVDMSCRSGSSQRFLPTSAPNDSVCIVSASGPEEYAWGSFSSALTDRFKPGTSLEDAFLQARAAQYEPAFPMISTPAGRMISEQLYRIMRPELRLSRDKDADNLSEALLKSAESCQDERDHIPEIVREIEILSLATGTQLLDTRALEAALKRYQDARQAWVRDLRAKGVNPLLQRREKFVGESSYPKGSKSATERWDFEYSWDQLATLNFNNILQTAQESLRTAKDPQSRANAQAMEAMVRKAQARQRELLAQYPALANLEQERKDAVQRLYQTVELARAVGVEERKVFQSLYAAASTQSSGSSACKNFRF